MRAHVGYRALRLIVEHISSHHVLLKFQLDMLPGDLPPVDNKMTLSVPAAPPVQVPLAPSHWRYGSLSTVCNECFLKDCLPYAAGPWLIK